MFRRIDGLMEETLPEGYHFDADADEVAGLVLSKSIWAVLGLTFDLELFTQLHYRQSIDADPALSGLFKDVFLFHWKEESQHAALDELEWKRCDALISADERDKAVDEFIELVSAVDGILQGQAVADAALCKSRKLTTGGVLLRPTTRLSGCFSGGLLLRRSQDTSGR
jgi:hypothetical protein